MKVRTVFLLLVTTLISSCVGIETPEPVYHQGYEQLTTQYLDWPQKCYLPEKRIFIIEDTSGVKGYPTCNVQAQYIDYTKWCVVLYSEGWFENITDVKVGSHWYINHDLKTVRFEIVTRVSENGSGLSSNGYTQTVLHAVLVPKIPKGYKIEVTQG